LVHGTGEGAALLDAGSAPRAHVHNEKINRTVRENSLAKVPVMLVVGKCEAEEGTVSILRFGSRDRQSATLADAMAALVDEATAPDVKRQRAATTAA
jgi:threonyl-tRNA synthetase